jgi:signal transduction histidine kinase
MVGDAERAFGKMVAIIAELSELGKLDDGRTTLHSGAADVFDIIERIAPAASEAADRGVRLVVRGPASGATLTGDAARLTQTFSSLVRAVLREQLANGVVVLDRWIEAGEARVVISPEAHADAVRSRAAADFDDKRGGMGLALPMARRVIELHGGRIWSPASDTGEASTRAAILVALPLNDTPA